MTLDEFLAHCVNDCVNAREAESASSARTDRATSPTQYPCAECGTPITEYRLCSRCFVKVKC